MRPDPSDPAPAPPSLEGPRFAGRVGLVTGGARGIGRAICEALAREGCAIAIGDIVEGLPEGAPYAKATGADLQAAAAAVESLGAACLAQVMDVRDPAACARLVEDAVETFGRLDFVIANAAVTIEGKLTDLTPEAFDAVIRTNLHGVFNIMAPALRQMRAGGRVVVIGSGDSRHAQAEAGPYVASKWGIVGLVKTAALEVAKAGVTVNAVLPGPVDTAMMNSPERYRAAVPDKPDPTREDYIEARKDATPMGVAWVKPGDVAAAVSFLLTEEARFISGVALSVDAADCANWT